MTSHDGDQVWREAGTLLLFASGFTLGCGVAFVGYAVGQVSREWGLTQDVLLAIKAWL